MNRDAGRRLAIRVLWVVLPTLWVVYFLLMAMGHGGGTLHKISQGTLLAGMTLFGIGALKRRTGVSLRGWPLILGWFGVALLAASLVLQTWEAGDPGFVFGILAFFAVLIAAMVWAGRRSRHDSNWKRTGISSHEATGASPRRPGS